MERSLSRRRSHREGRTPRVVGAIRQLPWSQPRLTYRPLEILSADRIEAIHNASLGVLETVGMKVLDAEARRIFREEGAAVDEPAVVVRLGRALVEEKVRLAPSRFTLHARNPARNVEVGGAFTFFSAVGGPAFVHDLEKGRRAGTYAELCDFIKLVQGLNILHQEGGGAFEPLDLPEASRHLDTHYAQLTLMDKNWQPWGLGAERARDG